MDVSSTQQPHGRQEQREKKFDCPPHPKHVQHVTAIEEEATTIQIEQPWGDLGQDPSRWSGRCQPQATLAPRPLEVAVPRLVRQTCQ